MKINLLFLSLSLQNALNLQKKRLSHDAPSDTESSSIQSKPLWFPLQKELFARPRRSGTQSGAIDLEQGCGFQKDCEMDYAIADVAELAKHQRANSDETAAAAKKLDDIHKEAKESCAEGARISDHGGWCYETPKDGKRITEGTDIDYSLSEGHNIADPGFVSGLVKTKLLLKKDGSCCRSFTDFGAGVGQFGHALRAQLGTNFEYYGYDGAGNVEEFTKNYTHFTDLTQPLNLKRTDWVFSSEVGEHIPHLFEKQVIANIHAHNCRGIILTWAVLGQDGKGHINCHSNEYLIKIFQGLGYKLNEELTQLLRDSAMRKRWWLKKSSMVLERTNLPEGCSDE